MSEPIRDADWWAAVQITRERAAANRRTLAHIAAVTYENRRVGDFAREIAHPGRLAEVLADWTAKA